MGRLAARLGIHLQTGLHDRDPAGNELIAEDGVHLSKSDFVRGKPKAQRREDYITHLEYRNLLSFVEDEDFRDLLITAGEQVAAHRN